MNAVRECGRSADSTTRSSSPACGDTAASCPRVPSTSPVNPPSNGALMRRPATATPRARPQRAAPLARSGGDDLLVSRRGQLEHGALALLEAPAEPDQGRAELVAP